MKFVLVHSKDTPVVRRYLPKNYFVFFTRGDHTIVAGEDNHGWTAESYVIPRLRSAVISAELITPHEYAERYMLSVLVDEMTDGPRTRP